MILVRIRLRDTAQDPEKLRLHDEHKPWILVPVFLVLAAFIYCFTQAADYLNLPMPEDLGVGLGLDLPEVFDDDHNVESKVYVSHTKIFRSDDERLILFCILFGTFLTSYFLPLRYKKLSIVGWFLLGFFTLYGPITTVILGASHLGVYLVFHHKYRHSLYVSALFGLAVSYWVMHDEYLSLDELIGSLVIGASLAVVFYRYGVIPLLERSPKLAKFLQTVVIQIGMILIVVGSTGEGTLWQEWKVPLGFAIFLFQWARLMVYQADYNDGEVPRDLSPTEYLVVFLTPACIPNFMYAPYVGQGYAYLNERYLCRHKNEIILGGLKLWLLALIYIASAEQLVAIFIDMMDERLNIRVFAFTSQLVRAYLRGEEIATPTVLITTFLDQARIFLVYGGVTHFRVGTWRIMGYDMDPQYNKPWLATNLMALWGRFAFHLREFLVRTFYYPVFLRYFKKYPTFRVFFATMVATIIGNLIWGHLPVHAIRDMEWDTMMKVFSTWPYFLLLGLSISLTQVYLLRRKRTRQPWTLDRRLPLDIMFAYLTFQFFSLIHVFIRPQRGGTLYDYLQLFLIGLGIKS